MANETGPKLQSYRFLMLYALAAAGGAIAYVPFLTILLPMRMSHLAGAADVYWLGYATFAGAIAASIGNIFFGWLSDVTMHRRAWVFCGLISSSLLLISFTWVERLELIIVLILGWQLALNMMLAPLGAWAGDNIPDSQKGLLGGLLSFAPAFGAISAAIITIPEFAEADMRLILVAAMVCVCVLPVLAFGSPFTFHELLPSKNILQRKLEFEGSKREAIVRMWLARMLIQISEVALFSYLYFWFRSVDPIMGDSETAQVLSIVLVAAIPIALVTGQWADRIGKPILPLAISAGISAIGLMAMAISTSLLSAISGYVVFGLAVSVFLSLHTSQTLRVLPKPESRGRDLGVFNLTNTTPSLVMPWIVITVVPIFGFSRLLALLAGLSFIACILLSTFPHIPEVARKRK